MTWRVTAALARALAVGILALGGAVVFRAPALVVLGLPFVAHAVLALLHRPSGSPRVVSHLARTTLHEGQGTRSHLTVTGEGIEHVTRAVVPSPYVALRPRHGTTSALVSEGLPPVLVGARRWGRRPAGDERVALTSAWGGFRAGPDELHGRMLTVLPTPVEYDAAAGLPDPVGLVGAHRSRRTGDGTEFATTRPFHAGDRLRRVNWRVSLRTRELHVDTTLTEDDTGLLLLVDGLADHGRSGGVDGAPSSLDLTVRAAAAVAGQHVRQGDRVSLRVVGAQAQQLRPGTGRRHLRRLLEVLARISPEEPRHEPTRLDLGVTGGTIVIVLSPMLSPMMATAAAALVRRGLPVLVIDTLPTDLRPASTPGTSDEIVGLAWRMRLLERDAVMARLAAIGTPVVAWRGPGTLDEVLRRLARQARLPRVASR